MTSKVGNLQKMEWIVCQQNSDATEDALKWSTVTTATTLTTAATVTTVTIVKIVINVSSSKMVHNISFSSSVA